MVRLGEEVDVVLRILAGKRCQEKAKKWRQNGGECGWYWKRHTKVLLPLTLEGTRTYYLDPPLSVSLQFCIIFLLGKSQN